MALYTERRVFRLPPGVRFERRYVWQVPVRAVHWIMVAAIATLCVTGWYVHDPYLLPGEYTMARDRLIHLMVGFVFTAALVFRGYWFLAGNRYSRWRSYLPMTPHQWEGIKEVIKHYAFIRKEPWHGAGHNPLAAFAYAGMYVLMALEAFTGMVLYSRGADDVTWDVLFGWPLLLVSEQTIRLTHFFLMFVFLAFVIVHLYLTVLLAREEGNGLVDSMTTGWKFIRVSDESDAEL